MRYHALATDYDGTLARHGEVDQPTLDALLPLNSDGIGQDSAATLFGANAFVEFRWRSAE